MREFKHTPKTIKPINRGWRFLEDEGKGTLYTHKPKTITPVFEKKGHSWTKDSKWNRKT
jgi:hypothetical protein